CVRRIERWIDLPAGNDRAFRLANVFSELFWKLHRPRDICHPTIKLAIDEIGAAPEKQTNWRGHNQIVAQIHPRDFLAPGIINREREQAEHSTVTRHSAFPHPKDRDRRAQHLRLIEQNVTEPATEDHAKERGTGDEVA